MKKILIISVTSGNNFILAEKIQGLIKLDNELITLADYRLPLYDGHSVLKNKVVINDLCKKVIDADGFIFCGPEYNGGSAPALTNAITWLSVATDNWRSTFVNKKAIIATHSGGAGFKFLTSFRSQLEHLGTIVYPRNIVVNKDKKFSDQSVKDILYEFEKLI